MIYDSECCGGRDCWPVPTSTVRSTVLGYIVKLNGMEKVFPYAQSRPSMDGRFHVCVVGGSLRCFYAPPTDS